MKKRINRLWWNFDRAFANSKKVWVQLTIIIGMTLLLVFLIAGVGQLAKKWLNYNFCEWLIDAIALAFKATSLPQSSNGTTELEGTPYYPYWWQMIAYLLGAIIFNGAIIAFVSNWLTNRLDAYRKGLARYEFADHLLFLGGSRIVLPMIKEIWGNNDMKTKDVVILTSDKVECLRTDIERYLDPDVVKKMKITVLSGDHYDKDTLESVHVGRAKRIYIVGDYLSGSEHDSENVACWKFVREICIEHNRNNVPCYLYFSRVSSMQLFYRSNRDATGCLDTTVLNYLESVSQRVLVHNRNENTYYPRLDRNGIGPDSKRRVHLVVCGMTSASYAIATTAAHLCHFPNSVDPQTMEIIPDRRTKITIIAPDMKKEMGFFTSHLSSLFSMSHYSYICEDKKKNEDKKPESRYGDFLDIEWEFIDGCTADDWVIKLLKDYYDDCVNKKKTYLSMAFCDIEKPDKNIAGAIYLPSEFHRIERFEDTHKINWEKTIPIFVFQPQNEELVRNAQREAPLYENIFSFGSMRESYDPSISQRIREGKRINYIYNKGEDYLYMTSDHEELDRKWREQSFLNQVSNIYCANHIGVKLRSMGIDEEGLRRKDKIPEEYEKVMAAVEHNRWNVEKLLLGYDPVEESRWRQLKEMESLKESDAFKKEMKELKTLKNDQYIHHCIAPFNQLLEDYQTYDYLIVRNLTDVLQEK